MADFAKEILPVNLEDEMKQSYLDYAMSVIVGRALPDVRDGLKPVHRRVLFAMSELGNEWNKPYKKSARVVGDVIGKYHPHGDAAVYDTIVRLAQPFAMRYMLVDGQGNFGSIDGDAPAAMRYTEVRMARISQQILADIDKETVDFAPNYDASEQEPVVFPTRIPNLLVNGATGIAVGMATNIPPHNLGEVVAACIALIDNPDLSVEELIDYLPGPDFPTAAIINGASGIHEAYHNGRGRVYIRARTHIEELDSGKQAIIVTELPYQVNKARLLEKIAELVKEKKLDGIIELRDESDKDGLRMYIELRRGEMPDVVLNNLYQHTQMQTVFGINMVALIDGQPQLLNLQQILQAFIRHRREVVTRRTLFELGKARDRTHVLEGLAVALANIDELIALIRQAPGPAEAKAALLERTWQPGSVSALLERAAALTGLAEGVDESEYGLMDNGYRLSPTQAQAILDLRLHRLTGLEQERIHGEYRELLNKIADLLDILTDPERLLQVIRDELRELSEQYNDPRRTEIRFDQSDLSLEDLIPREDMVVTLSHTGYAKIQPLTSYRAQHRGGRGRSAADIKEQDFIDKLWVANSHDTLLCFSNRGKVYWRKVYELPLAGRGARGKPINNLLPLEAGERISAVLPVREFDAEHWVFFATAQGTVKKTPLIDYSRPRTAGIIAINLDEDDQLVGVAITDGSRDIMLLSDAGKAIRFPESTIRSLSRSSRGVRGMRLADGQRIIALLVVDQGAVLTVTANGYGKRTLVDDYPLRGRGGQGVISIKTSARNGRVIGATQVTDDDQIMLITNAGTLVRTRVAEISLVGRNTQGVRLIRLQSDEQLIGLARIEADEADEVQDPDIDLTDHAPNDE
jgi:DNA gyrase subunit A